jgi:hypothetical protein
MGESGFQRSVFSKGGEQRSAQAVGIWRKHFLCLNQAGTSPHKKRCWIFGKCFSCRAEFCFCHNAAEPLWPSLDEASDKAEMLAQGLAWDHFFKPKARTE